MKKLFCFVPAPDKKGRILQLVLFGGIAGFLTIVIYFAGYRCPSRWGLGIECPACKITRASMRLLKLDFVGAFAENPLIYVVMGYLLFFAAMWMKGTPERFFSKISGRLFCGIFLAFWAVKVWRFIQGDYPDFLEMNAYLPRLWRFVLSLVRHITG